MQFVESACHIYSQPSLLLLGRSTFLITLILSRMQRVLHVTIAHIKFFDKLGSIMRQFLHQKILPMASLASLCFPWTQDELGILNPQFQIPTKSLYQAMVKALYISTSVLLLFHSTDTTQSSSCPNTRRYSTTFVVSTSATPSFFVLSTMKPIPRNFSFVTVGYFIFVILLDLEAVRPRSPNERNSSPYLISKLTLGTHSFCAICRNPFKALLASLPLTPRQWCTFWSFPIPHSSDNIWYRTILNTLSFQITLYHHASALFDTVVYTPQLSEVHTRRPNTGYLLLMNLTS
ncbi:hypothetical protein PHYBLDRAFT_153661 [Phycomyces blakesleeanus NRRL 1555(-)]|uniref:Uncharacterized protein n=1 Tax=Phycomyces blakesleeanus (strain ATCC 8743b / DSM 1359 / FGSC 10004 / NBRC 33097 / NRRL 1555) TaxID=763407 RepID=A0A167J6F0_PHYB8|nr:hypothetical protein PHYBLDRAFT_153661 [Phycomyces blakesleeanus NRRL 1555(-)]OAD65269.1 hypothetical protein PHYBLDRAFT_153661 [Phycomyces blakesleeanus NRRL 1555(-)]|eukprot:XP_018283309.1 hypothetical protein PHYBLDRAFT_153661 [Phycomyces blakesleeanus NRRL 1555(-)]